MKHELKKRVAPMIALLMVALTVCFMPRMGETAHGASGDPAIVEGSAGALEATANTADAQTVWYAGRPWYVISHGNAGNEFAKNSSAMTLFSKDAVTLRGGDVSTQGEIEFKSGQQSGYDLNDYANNYKGSTVQSYMDGLYNDGASYGTGLSFSAKEKQAVTKRTLAVEEYIVTDPLYSPPYSNGVSGEATEGYLWPLSTAEAYVLPDEVKYTSNNMNYWLRSPGRKTLDDYTGTKVRKDQYDPIGIQFNEPVIAYHNSVRPAFHLNTDAVLFTSAAEGGKPAVDADTVLAQVGTNSGDEWKLTLKDDGTIDGLDGHADFEIDEEEKVYFFPATNQVSVAYKGAATGENEYISVLVKDGDGNVTHYARLGKSSSTDEVVFKVDDDILENGTVYLFNEQYNGDKKTDYASALKEVKIPDPVKVSLVVDNKDAAADFLDVIGTPEDVKVELNDAQDTIIFSLPNLDNVEAALFMDFIRDALGFIDEDYDGYLNTFEVGYQKVYESQVAFNADIAAHRNDYITDGLTLYVQWERPIKNVDLTVTVPKCGYTVSGSNTESQDPKPEYTVEAEGIDANIHSCLWWAEASAQESSTAIFTGQVEAGIDGRDPDKLYPRAEVFAKYGYYFPSSGVTAKINDEAAKDIRSTIAALFFAGEIEVSEHDWDEGEVTTEPTAVADGVMTYKCKHFDTCGGTKTEPIPKEGYLLSIGKSEGGKVTISTKRDGQDIEPQNDNAAPGNYTLKHGANATLTAVPDEHYRFVGWYKGTVGESGFVEDYDRNGYIDTEPVLIRTGWANSEVYALFEPLIKVTLKGSSIDGGSTAQDYVLEVQKGTPWTNISVSNKVTAILNHFTEESYAPFGGSLRIMTKELSGFSSWEEVVAEDEANHDYQFDEETTLYIPLAKTIDAVELKVDTPICGQESEVVEDDSGFHVNKDYPKASSTNEQVEPSGAQLQLTEDYTLAGAVWLKDENTALSGKLEGGETYRAELAVIPAFGYQFAEEGNPKTLTVTGANGDEAFREGDYTGEMPGGDFFVRFIQFTIDAQHDWSEWAESKAPTCEEPGEESRECKGCGKKETRKGEDALGHDWGKWVVTKQPTTEAEGEETRTCSRCGEKETRAVPKLDPPDSTPSHTNSTAVYITAARRISL